MSNRKILQFPHCGTSQCGNLRIFHLNLSYSWLKSHQINLGMLSDNEFIISRRIAFCQEFYKLWNEGYNIYCLDETYVNGNDTQTFQKFSNYVIPFFQLITHQVRWLLIPQWKVQKRYILWFGCMQCAKFENSIIFLLLYEGCPHSVEI